MDPEYLGSRQSRWIIPMRRFSLMCAYALTLLLTPQAPAATRKHRTLKKSSVKWMQTQRCMVHSDQVLDAEPCLYHLEYDRAASHCVHFSPRRLRFTALYCFWIRITPTRFQVCSLRQASVAIIFAPESKNRGRKSGWGEMRLQLLRKSITLVVHLEAAEWLEKRQATTEDA
ncbi:hypothetical protein B0H11DRAFT_356531 [Mycena galericulata]|nr:hypothetical protein B0H11DRAFT_356531 [Mycena galericulata]